MENEVESNSKKGRGLAWRLGLLLLNGYIGTTILSEEILKIKLPLKKVSLFN